MTDILNSGSIAYVVLAVLAAEAIFLARILKRFPGFIGGLAAGACLVLALRAALLDHGAAEIAVYLALSFMCHVAEVWQWLQIAKRMPR